MAETTPAVALDPRDAILQTHTPALMVPRHGVLPLMDKPGHRFLVAASGLWLEVLRPWMHARVPVGYTEVPLPYGEVRQHVQYAFSARDIARVQARFVKDAIDALPNECAGWGVYNEASGELAYRPLLADVSSPGGVQFHRPRLAEHEHLAVDLHSHAQLDAYFSATDDADDQGEVKIAIVVGNVHREPTAASRLCLLGAFVGETA